eukprot:3941444-Rhodomonas_salina.1
MCDRVVSDLAAERLRRYALTPLLPPRYPRIHRQDQGNGLRHSDPLLVWGLESTRLAGAGPAEFTEIGARWAEPDPNKAIHTRWGGVGAWLALAGAAGLIRKVVQADARWTEPDPNGGARMGSGWTWVALAAGLKQQGALNPIQTRWR